MGNSSSALPYSIGEKVDYDNVSSSLSSQVNTGWTIHEGKRKRDGMAVTVFQGHKPSMAKTAIDRNAPAKTQVIPALHHFHTVKTLVHPHILKVYATLDTDYPQGGSDTTASSSSAGTSSTTSSSTSNPSQLSKLEATATTGDLIVVTEPCVPLRKWLDSSNNQHQRSPEELAWGLQCIVEALGFLHGTAKLAHGNISPDSIYVTLAGDWKLFDFSICTPVGVAAGGQIGPTTHFRTYEALFTPHSYRSSERREGRWEAIAACGVHAMDAFSFGIFISNIYKGDVPLQLKKAVTRLQTNNLKMRPRLPPLLKCPVFMTPLAQMQTALVNYPVSAPHEKLTLLQQLPSTLQQNTVMSQDVAVHKVLPLLTQNVQQIVGNDSLMAQDIYRREVLAVLPPLFYIAETYLTTKAEQDEKVQTLLTPMIQKLFQVNDRGVRGALLGRVNFLTQHLTKSVLNTSVFEPMCSGYSDSSAALREMTLKSTLVLVPSLNAANMEKLSRYLVRLQSDEEASIRTNAVIFCSKIAPHLPASQKQKLMLNAFTRAMKDPFTPCRLAGLRAVTSTQEYFDAKTVATQVLPSVVPHLMDEVADVRKAAFAVVDVFLETIRKAGDEMNNQNTNNGGTSASSILTGAAAASTTTTTTKTTTPAPNSGSSYLSGLSSWMTSSTASATKPEESKSSSLASSTTATSSNKPVAAPKPSNPTAAARVPAPASAPVFASLTLSDANIGGSGGGGGGGNAWDDDDDDILGDDSFGESLLTGGVGGSKTTTSIAGRGGGSSKAEEDDFFASIMEGSNSGTRSKPRTGTRSGSSSSSSGAKLMVPGARKSTTTPKPVVKKLDVSGDDDWDDF